MTASTPGRWTALRAATSRGFGGKSANLGELLAAEIPVPPGFALSTAAFEAFVREAGLPDRSTTRWPASRRRRRRDRPASQRDRRGDARRAGARRRCAREVAEQYARARATASPPVAVRSSAVGEDSEDATFAGQQETYLWVRGAEQRVRRGPRLLGQPVQPAGDQLPRAARRGRARRRRWA